MTTLRVGPERAEHYCPHPCRDICSAGGVPSLPLGSAWECEQCRRVWLVVRPPEVQRGMQRVPPLWHPATWWETRRARKAAR